MGVPWSTGAAPRWDLLQWSLCPRETTGGPVPPFAFINSSGGDRDAALVHTHGVLKRYVLDAYFAPLRAVGSGPRGKSGGAAKTTRTDAATMSKEREREATGVVADCDALPRVVLLPAHGGYRNVTSQPDLYWAAHLGDLTRMRHSRTVIGTLATTTEAFAKDSRRLPPLPHPPSFDASRVAHLRQLLALLQSEHRAACATEFPADMQQALRYTFDPAVARGDSWSTPRQQLASFSSYVSLVDVRSATDYHALHLCGAVSVPMSFPGAAYGASKAELRLPCATEEQRAEVLQRLSALSPESRVHVLTLADLPCPSE
ncbi:hypothetical protein JKF63_01690 [Porcisia hertigi]|uniref:Uncharacterized protein n=1 Tax=Porcisia hertigi TaxID=2761500 RepID=A0A836IG84_9TRYP|nr:hypothetical protein JKF63_01690 [Porcisia hertigi]